jgi:hypothetical protein
MKIRTRVLAAAGAVAMAGSFAAFAAPGANAVVKQVGTCTGSLTLDTITPPLSDQTVVGTKIVGVLMKTEAGVLVNGQCSGVAPLVAIPVRPGDPHLPQPTGDLHAKLQAVALLGNPTCASGAAVAHDANAANAWPESGTVSFTFNETYNDLIGGALHNYTMKSNISLLGFNPANLDQVDLGGVNVNTGVGAGLTLTGSVWEDPVVKSDTDSTDIYNVGYELNIAQAIGCTDTTPNNAHIAQVESGGGGTTSTSLLGSTGIPGISFQTGE